MNILTVLLIALGLAMDACAVSVASGFAIKRLKIEHALRIAVYFGLFQAFMPLLGWFLGLTLRNYISEIDHWIAFALLCFIGCKMIYESFRLEKTENPLDFKVLILLSIATSIDALAVGVSLAFLRVSISGPVLIIGIVTFLLSLIGVFAGNKIGHFFENKIEFAGGVILIGIGIKILFEHMF